MMPLSIATLGAIDLARGTAAKVQLQDALDAAALAAARVNTEDEAVLQAEGERFLGQNLKTTSDFKLASKTFKYGVDGRVIATAQVELKPYIAGIITGGPMKVAAAAEVVRANTKVEVALVLDNTTSMLEGYPTSKISQLKEAAKNFVDTMETASKQSTNKDAIKVSLVPFSNTVRLEASTYRYSTWIDQNGASPINDEIFTTATSTQHANRFDLFTKLGTSWEGCVEMRKAPYDVQDTPPESGATLYTPYFAPDEPDETSDGHGHEYQNDYLDDGYGKKEKDWRVRQGAIAKYVKTNGLSTSKGPNRGCALQKVYRLTNDWINLRDRISKMNASGSTNIPIGLAWGWNTLIPIAPFADGAPYDTAGLKKVIVLMTDGENTIPYSDTPNDSEYSGSAYLWQGRVLTSSGMPLETQAQQAERTAALDSRLKLLCDNIKARGILIYTVRVEVTSGTNDVLEKCATSKSYYFDVKKADKLDSVFQVIAGQIAALHLAR